MAKKKFPYILIKDAKNGFRTQLVGGNGEPLMTSKVLESAKEVKVNLVAVELTSIDMRLRHIFTNDKIFKNLLKHEIRYEGKSEAIYKMFKIEKIS